MPLDEQYYVRTDLAEFFLDKDTGLPLANGTLEFYVDDDRITAKDVYELTGTPPNYTYTPLVNPVSLNAVGAPINASNEVVPLYFKPFDDDGNVQNYYIIVKNSSGTVQYTLPGWPNVTDGSSPVDDTHGKVSNELTNPEFVDVYFNPDQTDLTVSISTANQVTPIGPGWDLITSGTGTVKIERKYLQGNTHAPSDGHEVNPAYSLVFTPSGATSMVLRQRLDNDPGIWAGNYLSGYFIARSTGATGGSVTMDYVPSGGTATPQTIATIPSLTSNYLEGKGTVLVTTSGNTQTSENGYVDIRITLPFASPTEITAIQAVGMGQDQSAAEYDSQPANRQRSLNIQAYRESMLILPKNSILSGWNFPLNPWQFTTTTSTVVTQAANTGTYTADQTIFMNQNTDSYMIGRAGGDNNGALDIRKDAGGTPGALALIQYVDQTTARQVVGQYVSCLVRGIVNSNSQSVKFKMAIFHRTNTPPNLQPFTDVTNPTGTPNTGWTVATPELDPEYTFETATLSPAGRQTYPYYAFNKILIPNTAKYIAVVLYTTTGYVDDGVMYLHDISCVPNEFALDATPQTYDQCLQECQFYYEKSYADGVLPGTVDNTNNYRPTMNTLSIAGVTTYLYASNWQIIYRNTKCKVPHEIITYDLSGTAGSVNAVMTHGTTTPVNASKVVNSFWTPSIGQDLANFIPNTATNLGVDVTLPSLTSNYDGFLTMNYTIDARLGLP